MAKIKVTMTATRVFDPKPEWYEHLENPTTEDIMRESIDWTKDFAPEFVCFDDVEIEVTGEILK